MKVGLVRRLWRRGGDGASVGLERVHHGRHDRRVLVAQDARLVVGAEHRVGLDALRLITERADARRHVGAELMQQ
eukprot:2843014-Pleurochrysis_carterae.AAC.1